MSYRKRIICEDVRSSYIGEAWSLLSSGRISGFLRRELLLFYLIMFRRQGSHFRAHPRVVNIELTNLCNLKCRYCITGLSKGGRPPGRMSLQTFRKVAEGLPRSAAMLFAGFGEPFLHDGLESFLELAASSGLSAGLDIYSNFGAISEERVRRLLDHPFRTLIISLDAMSRETFMELKGYDAFEQVFQNIRVISDELRRRPQGKQNVVVQMIATQKNFHEMQDFMETIRDMKLIPRVKRLNTNSPGLSKNQIQELEINKLTRYSRIGHSRRCDWVWGGLQVFWNGDVTVCCQDPLGLHIYGNVRQKTAMDLLNIDQGRCDFRRRYYEDPNQIDICRRCDVA
jgi:pyruvate-formate lyase-activating enzyme